jgi:hypothetical protein
MRSGFWFLDLTDLQYSHAASFVIISLQRDINRNPSTILVHVLRYKKNFGSIFLTRPN